MLLSPLDFGLEMFGPSNKDVRITIYTSEDHFCFSRFSKSILVTMCDMY